MDFYFKQIPLAAFGILVTGNVLHIIGLATPKWFTADIDLYITTVEGTRGLWESCLGDKCETYDPDTRSDWLKICEAMASLGILAGCLAAVMPGLIVVNDFRNKKSDNDVVGVLSLLASIASSLMILICVVVFAWNIKQEDTSWDFGYSFALSLAGALLIAIGGGITFYVSR